MIKSDISGAAAWTRHGRFERCSPMWMAKRQHRFDEFRVCRVVDEGRLLGVDR
jgi:hypothetical protein